MQQQTTYELDPIRTVTPPAPSPHRFSWPFRRSRSERMIAGVAGGIGTRIGLSPIYVRAAFLCLALAGFVGVILYVLFALLVPPDDGSVEPAPPLSIRERIGLLLMFGSVMLVLQMSSIWFGLLVWPATLVTFGLAIAIDTSGVNYERSIAGIAGADGRRRSWWIVVGGVVIMVAGFSVAFSSLDQLQGIGVLAISVVAAIAGFFLVAGPWIWSLVEDLGSERRARIRSEEKAEMAAHLHDSVLQTLALIQRTDDPKKMVTLARGQERDLRAWLFDEAAGNTRTLVGALQAAATKVEEDHDVPVSVVVVGEPKMSADRRKALVAATTEAMMNAAEHSNASKVSVFAEATDDGVEVFVTDQGQGFDPTSVNGDRKGIAESIKGRMTRHGGTVTIDSEVGGGTEVHLTMKGGTL